MITGNKGEWSEIYTLLKVISDKKLFAGDIHLNQIEELIYPIVKVLREEAGETHEYFYDKELVIIKDQKEEIRIPISEFTKQAKFLLSKLQEKTKRTFSIPEVEEFMKSFKCKTLKAKSSIKSDIRIVIHDQRTNHQSTLGFSIKSQLGSPSTLLNAGKTTNFIYKIKGIDLTQYEIEEINSLSSKSKIIDRIKLIQSKGGNFEFLKLEKQIFSNNLVLIDSLLPQILSQIVFEFYSGSFSHLTDLVDVISNKNPLHFDMENEHKFYEYKMKRFLTDVAFGMMPSKVWTGQYDATGGYLVVKEDGEILCYHIYNRNEFENYLYANTKLETASSHRHGFGKVYIKEEEFYFNLNLQIRFK